MKPAGRKEKGRRLELKFAQMLRKIDPNAKRMVLSGADWAFKSDIYTSLPYHFECKNQERMVFWDWWQQCHSQSDISKTPVLIHTANHRPIMASMLADDFVSFIQELHQLRDEIASLKEEKSA